MYNFNNLLKILALVKLLLIVDTIQFQIAYKIFNFSGIIDYDVAVVLNGTITFQCEVSLFDGAELVGSVLQGCNGHIEVANAKLWWPVYMSDTPGHLYVLQVPIIILIHLTKKFSETINMLHGYGL